MQQKESKTNWHFRLSIAKSIVRLFAGFFLVYQDFFGAGAAFMLAEVIGIIEEF
jgi:hypothetical protein